MTAETGVAAGRPQPATTVESPGGPFIRHSQPGRRAMYTEQPNWGGLVAQPMVAMPGYAARYRIKTTFTEEALASWSTYFAMARPERAAKRIAALTADSEGHQLWGGLDVRPDDLLVEKNRFSAFIQGSSRLAEILRARGLDTVVVTGTVTNVCCESTARDAMMLNFKTIMVTDGNAAMTDDDHAASLVAFYLTFGDIMSTDMLIDCLKRKP